jgi:hypothetical protein
MTTQFKKFACKKEYLNKFLLLEPELRCNNPKCWGAHSVSELEIEPAIKKFESIDWKKIDFYDFYQTLIKGIYSSLSAIRLFPELFEDFKSKKIPEMEFLEILVFWRKCALVMRKNRNEFDENPKMKSFGFKSKEDIPILHLGDWDPFAWSLTRACKPCQKHLSFFEEIKKGTTKYDLQEKMCSYSANCKAGIHHRNNQICLDDLLYGKCDCLSMEETNKSLNNLNNQIQKIIKKINSKVKVRLPKIENCYDDLRKLILDLRGKVVDIELTQRKIHLSEKGVSPIQPSIDIIKLIIKEEEEKAKELLLLEKAEEKVKIQGIKSLDLIRGKFLLE